MLTSLPPDVLDHVAFHLATAHNLGPPAALVPLLSAHSHLYSLLSITRNAHLYARIFRAKFDYHAAQRRFSQHASYSLALARQLVRNCQSLQRIRRGHLCVDDLYRAFALCLENDGMNAAQLAWAGLPDLIERYVLNRLWHGRDRSHNWPPESRENAFALWLYWYSLTPDRLAAHSPAERNQLQSLIRPYAVYNFRYPPFLAPDIHWSFPLRLSPDVLRDHSVLTPHGFYPQYREPKYIKHSFIHYDHDLILAEPPIGLVAKLLYVALLEHQPQEYPSPDILPIDRAEADQIGARGPTLADYLAFGDLRAARPPTHARSSRHDSDWNRWRACYNPWSDNIPQVPAYAPGSLTGLWAGRFLDPDVDDYFRAVTAGSFGPDLEQPNITSASAPLYMRLREHHCVSPAAPMPAEEDVMNAFFARDFPHPELWTVSEQGRRLGVRRKGRGEEWVYETFVSGRAGAHDDETCALCAERRSREEARAAERRRTGADVDMREGCRCEGDSGCECGDCDADEDMEEDEEDDARIQRIRRAVQDALGRDTDLEEFLERVAREVDSEHSADFDSDAEADADTEADDASVYSCSAAPSDSDGSTAGDIEDSDMAGGADRNVERRCDGVVDVIVTGETPRTPALAWRDFRIYGRVRPWDGLVVLVRAPADPRERDTYVFRGYVVGGEAIVGAWRHVTDSVHSVPVEGAFVVGRLDEEAEAQRT
ncbi:hypothetical protein L226DRAFT_574533 [Lentinus tigrinus ALCF2SS1-7]|uniref:F-box domain-containing protein n=1 Tax=Lentinus tigrinus ALCF2SS1-6 TaxID=1328759 RepID=A0A5C2RUY7_9APHY|nr:hypothetical protein L227DRAFT_588517 [Lentinus tigrinus ALCF2SS1-6]RPD70642.1 hypothetical protein L226DRAFT_574533 [Lentinus tigrinus ALCF2SS1-7]